MAVMMMMMIMMMMIMTMMIAIAISILLRHMALCLAFKSLTEKSKATMARIFNMEFLILLLMAASTRAGAFPVNDQNDPYSSDYFSESLSQTPNHSLLVTRAVRRRHYVGGSAPVNFGRRRRHAAGPK